MLQKDHPLIGETKQKRAKVWLQEGKLEECLKDLTDYSWILIKAFCPHDDPKLISLHDDISVAYMQPGDFQESLAFLLSRSLLTINGYLFKGSKSTMAKAKLLVAMKSHCMLLHIHKAKEIDKSKCSVAKACTRALVCLSKLVSHIKRNLVTNPQRIQWGSSLRRSREIDLKT